MEVGASSSLCQNASTADIEDISSIEKEYCVGPDGQNYVCVGDSCILIKRCDPSPQATKKSTEIQEVQTCPWREFDDSCKPLFRTGKVWAIVTQPCVGKAIACTFESSIRSLEENQSIYDGRPWLAPRIRFNTDTAMTTCEGAIGVFGKVPFIALIDLPHESAYVLEVLELSDAAKETKLNRELTARDFCVASECTIRKFVEEAAAGRWPKAPMGEKPPQDDIDVNLGLSVTKKAVQSSYDRLVRGAAYTFREVKIRDVLRSQQSLPTGARSDSRDNLSDLQIVTGGGQQQPPTPMRCRSSLDMMDEAHHRHSGEAVGGTAEPSLLCIVTLWGQQCPCCPPVIQTLDRMVSIMTSRDFLDRFPSFPLRPCQYEVRHVICDAECNDLPDDAWPGPFELSSPVAYGADGLRSAFVDVGRPEPLGSSTAVGSAEKSLPCITAFRDGNRVAHFRGVRTVKNLLLFVCSSFGILPQSANTVLSSRTQSPVRATPPGAFADATDDDKDDTWCYYLLEELTILEQNNTTSLMKRSRE